MSRGYTLGMRYQVILMPGEDGWIVAECPALPGCISQGLTRDAALANIAEAISGWLEVERLDNADAVPLARRIELTEVEVAA